MIQTIRNWARRARSGARVAELEDQIRELRDERVVTRREVRDLRLELGDSRERLTEALDRGGDPAARRLIGSILKHSPFDKNCGIGTEGRCVVHFNEVHCSVAWLKNWSSGLTATDGIVPLANVMTNRPQAPSLLAAALNEYADRHEVAGAEGTESEARVSRSDIRLVRAMAHAASATGI